MNERLSCQTQVLLYVLEKSRLWKHVECHSNEAVNCQKYKTNLVNESFKVVDGVLLLAEIVVNDRAALAQFLEGFIFLLLKEGLGKDLILALRVPFVREVDRCEKVDQLFMSHFDIWVGECGDAF